MPLSNIISNVSTPSYITDGGALDFGPYWRNGGVSNTDLYSMIDLSYTVPALRVTDCFNAWYNAFKDYMKGTINLQTALTSSSYSITNQYIARNDTNWIVTRTAQFGSMADYYVVICRLANLFLDTDNLGRWQYSYNKNSDPYWNDKISKVSNALIKVFNNAALGVYAPDISYIIDWHDLNNLTMALMALRLNSPTDSGTNVFFPLYSSYPSRISVDNPQYAFGLEDCIRFLSLLIGGMYVYKNTNSTGANGFGGIPSTGYNAYFNATSYNTNIPVLSLLYPDIYPNPATSGISSYYKQQTTINSLNSLAGLVGTTGDSPTLGGGTLFGLNKYIGYSIGTSNDTASSTGTTLFALNKYVVNTVGSINTSVSSGGTINTNVNIVNNTTSLLNTKIGTLTDAPNATANQSTLFGRIGTATDPSTVASIFGKLSSILDEVTPLDTSNIGSYADNMTVPTVFGRLSWILSAVSVIGSVINEDTSNTTLFGKIWRVQDCVNSIGRAYDVGDTSNTATLFALNRSMISSLNSISTGISPISTINTNVNTVITAVGATSDTNTTSIFGKLNAIMTEVGTAGLPTLDSKVGSSADTASSTGTTLFALDKYVATTVGTINTTLGTVNTNVSTINTNVNTINTTTSNTNTTVGTINTNVNTVSNNVTAVNNTLNTVNTKVGADTDTVTTSIFGKLNAIMTEVGTAGLPTLDSKVGTSADTASSTGTTLFALNNYISNTVGSINTILSNVNNNVSTVNTNVNTINTTTSNTNTTVGTINTNVNTVNTTVSSLNTKIGTLTDTPSTTANQSTLFGRIGTAADNGATSTVFGQIANVISISQQIKTAVNNLGTTSSSSSSSSTTLQKAVDSISSAIGIFPINTTIQSNLSTISGQTAKIADILTAVNKIPTTNTSTTLTTITNSLQTIQNNLATVSTNLINGINDQASTSIYKTIQTINNAQASLTTQITAGFVGISSAISAISNNSQVGNSSNDLSSINNSLTQMNTTIQNMNQQLQSLQVVVQNIASNQGISTPMQPAQTSWWQTIINSPWVVITICVILLMIVRRITSTESY